MDCGGPDEWTGAGSEKEEPTLPAVELLEKHVERYHKELSQYGNR